MKPENSTPCSEVEDKTTRPLGHAIRKPNVSLKCHSCQRRFPSFVRLQRHLSLVHKSSGKLFWCSKCSLAFNEISVFVRHSRLCRQGENQDSEGLHETPPHTSTHAHEPSRQDAYQRFAKKYGFSENSSENQLALGPDAGHNSKGTTTPSESVREEERVLDSERGEVATVALPTSQVVSGSHLGQGKGIKAEADGSPGRRTSVSDRREQGGSQAEREYNQRLMTGSLLAGHPTMADIGKTASLRPGAPLSPKTGACRTRRATRASITPRRSLKHGHLCRRPTFSPRPTSQNGHQLPRRAGHDDVNITIPATVRTVNLMSSPTEGDHSEAKQERAEILCYLRTVTAKLDAVIRHFNVPFLDDDDDDDSNLLSSAHSTSHRNSQHERMRNKDINPVLEQPSGQKKFPSKEPNPEYRACLSGSRERSYDRFPDAESDLNPDTDDTVLVPSEASEQVPSPSSGFQIVEQTGYDEGKVHLPVELVEDLHSKSLHRGNFAKRLVFQLFSPDERRGRNCFGRRAGLQSGPKAPLDPIKLQFVREKVFQYYPCEPGLEETLWRRQCVIAVDTALRGENRPNKRLIHSSIEERLLSVSHD